MKKSLSRNFAVVLAVFLSTLIRSTVYAADMTKIGITAIVSAPPFDENQKKSLTVSDHISVFERASGDKFADDRVLLKGAN